MNSPDDQALSNELRRCFKSERNSLGLKNIYSLFIFKFEHNKIFENEKAEVKYLWYKINKGRITLKKYLFIYTAVE